MYLQRDDIDMVKIRIVFDKLIREYPDMAHYLAKNSQIVTNPNFEAALIKILSKKEDELSAAEKREVARLRIPTETITDSEEDFAESIEKEAKKVKLTKSLYVDLSYIIPTSNRVERAFSAAKLVHTDNRKRLTPCHLEEIMFLKLNRHWWDVRVVHAAIDE